MIVLCSQSQLIYIVQCGHDFTTWLHDNDNVCGHVQFGEGDCNNRHWIIDSQVNFVRAKLSVVALSIHSNMVPIIIIGYQKVLIVCIHALYNLNLYSRYLIKSR